LADIIEVFWNARPHLDRLRIKVGANALDPRAEQLFADVRAAAAAAFPEAVTLVRIAVRKAPETDLRVRASGPAPDLDPLRQAIDAAVVRAAVPEAA
jgi:hypothetical protein